MLQSATVSKDVSSAASFIHHMSLWFMAAYLCDNTTTNYVFKLVVQKLTQFYKNLADTMN